MFQSFGDMKDDVEIFNFGNYGDYGNFGNLTWHSKNG